MAGVNPYAAADEAPKQLQKHSFQHPAQLSAEPIRIHPHSLTHPRSEPLVTDKLTLAS